MKVRIGFVSNSSTTSFCIFGFSDDIDTIKENLKNKGVECDDLWDYVEDLGMSCHVEPYGGYAYIGFDMENIPDDVVVGEWKKEKEAEIKKAFGTNVKCATIAEGWRDG